MTQLRSRLVNHCILRFAVRQKRGLPVAGKTLNAVEPSRILGLLTHGTAVLSQTIGPTHNRFEDFSMWDALLFQPSAFVTAARESALLGIGDPANKQSVYRQWLDGYDRYNRSTYGICASPTMAGKAQNIYLTDDAGFTHIIRPGRTFTEIGRNVLENIHESGAYRKSSSEIPVASQNSRTLLKRSPIRFSSLSRSSPMRATPSATICRLSMSCAIRKTTVRIISRRLNPRAK